MDIIPTEIRWTDHRFCDALEAFTHAAYTTPGAYKELGDDLYRSLSWIDYAQKLGGAAAVCEELEEFMRRMLDSESMRNHFTRPPLVSEWGRIARIWF